MKTLAEIKDAKGKVIDALATAGINDVQKALFAGMLNGLNWAAELPHANTIDRLLAGEPIAAGKDPSPALARLADLPKMRQSE